MFFLMVYIAASPLLANAEVTFLMSNSLIYNDLFQIMYHQNNNNMCEYEVAGRPSTQPGSFLSTPAMGLFVLEEGWRKTVMPSLGLCTVRRKIAALGPKQILWDGLTIWDTISGVRSQHRHDVELTLQNSASVSFDAISKNVTWLIGWHTKKMI